MAKKTSIIEILKEYILELEKNHIHIETAFLFGSYAKGTFNEWSDIDIALVSNDFKGISVLDAEKIARPTLDIDYRISPLTYRPEDFNNQNLFIKEIMSSGVKII